MVRKSLSRLDCSSSGVARLLHTVRRYLSAFAIAALVALSMPLSAAPVYAESPATVPTHFRDELVWDGLTSPTAVAFAPNGRVFVSQKNGRINVYDSLTDSTATQFIDLTSDVMNYWDRGLVGLVVDPDFPTRPYVYVAYTYDHILGDPDPAPKWGIGQPSDPCPTPPGGNTDGCLVSSRVERLTVSSNGTGNSVSARKVLVTDWCQQYPSHTIGTLAFGPEGALYVSGGDGASFDEGDWGQLGGTNPPGGPYITPQNPCDDPLNEGGAVRVQDYRTNGDPMGLDGTIIRIDPDTGDAWPDNANAGNADDNKARTIAYGLRNPFRITIRPNGHVWIADVGWSAYEEIDRITDPDAAPKNFAWPCLEGNEARPQYENVPLCTTLTSPAAPMFEYWHESEIVSGDGCTPGSSSITGITFVKSNSNYPGRYDDGLFFTDWNRGCIWFVPDGGGNPDFGAVEKFADLRRDTEIDGGAVYLGMTPAGDLIYADFNRGEVRAIRYYPVNAKPNANFTATPSYGKLPLTVKFDASGSTDPDGNAITYAWDLDGDGQYDDSTAKKPSRTYSSLASTVVSLRVTDNGVPSEFDTASKTIYAGSWAPVISMTKPKSSVTWEQGTVIPFAATATDEDGSIGASGFRWVISISHCPSNCHLHEVEIVRRGEVGLVHRAVPRVAEFDRRQADGDRRRWPFDGQDPHARAEAAVHRHREFDVRRRHRLAGGAGDHVRLYRDQVLSQRPREPRPDGLIPLPRLRPAVGEQELLHRRQQQQAREEHQPSRQGGHHPRMHRHAILPERQRQPRPDGLVPGPRLRPAVGHQELLHRRQQQPAREEHQPAREGRDHQGLHPDKILPEQHRDPRADGGVPSPRLRGRLIVRARSRVGAR